MVRNPWKVATVVLAVALAAMVGKGAVREASADQPNMKEALGHLDQALSSLNKATADKGGHRAKAIDLTKSAIDETKKGIEYDRKH